ncbi:hypothetical protein AIOL_003018 [Candidatus Rhodobacter oscarellae]|uniref:Lipoprotein n=1 Tax=Candidatus Rhodobacter oscarellae TaxID=1675527 RepID=A0A0J9GWZ1_9RHOB|nr:hypothetical protein [Candidatus Rhodobacter lobularis]KMW58048.1 hypothetical protein AIOL_003018 [Candidatus Rhodobacter lobularis]
MIQRALPFLAALLLAGCLGTTEAPPTEDAPETDDSGYVFDDAENAPEGADEAAESPAEEAPQGAEEAPQAEAEPAKPDPNAAFRLECTKRKGSLSKLKSGAFVCVTRTRDANRRCVSAGECDGACLARSGTCAPVKPLVGCHEILTNRGARATVCVE